MNNFCEFLKDLIPNTAERIQAYAALVTSYIAYKAYNTWKTQKHYDLYIEIRSLRHFYLRLFYKNILQAYKDLNNPTLSNYKKVDDAISQLHKELTEAKYFINYSNLEIIKNLKEEGITDLINWYKEFNQLYNGFNKIEDMQLPFDQQLEIRKTKINDFFKKSQVLLDRL